MSVFLAALVFHFWGVNVGWQSRNLPGVEYRQAQTALSAYFIQQDNEFVLDYPTPVLGKPWSVPMEFPLYQWTVVVVSNLSNWSITKSGRAVSIGCFYLTLPAIFLLLAWWQVQPRHRWLVLAVVATCPFYVFYTRGVLIESMALMFSTWFCVAYARAVETRRVPWLVLAMAMGIGAGLVKVTTLLLFLLPLVVWSLLRLRRERASGAWRMDLAWMALAMLLPVAATLWWKGHADAIKALNPQADFLSSDRLMDFNLGTTATRLSPELWALKWRIVRDELTWLPLVAALAVLGLAVGRPRWREIAGCGAVFGLALVAFPELYAYHDYYYAASLLWLLLAMGLVLVALAESRVPRWLLFGVTLAVVGAQVGYYFWHYYPMQRHVSPGGDGASRLLRALTLPDEVIVITGQDWNSMIPFYAQRRALMLRDEVAAQPERVVKALEALRGEKIGALLVTGASRPHRVLIDWLAARGLSATPVFTWREVSIHLPESRVQESLRKQQTLPVADILPAPGREQAATGNDPRLDFSRAWHPVGGLPAKYAAMFANMTPRPVRFFSTFGPSIQYSRRGEEFSLHPVTRLVFSLPAGQHTFRTSLAFSPDANRANIEGQNRTDGVQVRLARLAGEAMEGFYDRQYLPADTSAAEATLELAIAFTLAAPSEVEFYVGPGPAGRDTRDWVSLDGIRIESQAAPATTPR